MFGFGTWERIKDKFLYALGDSGLAGETGGEEKVALSLAQMPRHQHLGIQVDNPRNGSSYIGKEQANAGSWMESDANVTVGVYQYNESAGFTGNFSEKNSRTGFSGLSEAHNNMPPYMKAYMWVRVA